MDESKKKFKIVYNHKNSTFTIKTLDEQGVWETRNTFITKAEDNGSMINVEILWRIDYWSYLGYEFVGIKAINLY